MWYRHRLNEAHEPRVRAPATRLPPRTPRASQQFRFALDSNGLAIERVVWGVNGAPLPGNHGEPASRALAPVGFSVAGVAPPAHR